MAKEIIFNLKILGTTTQLKTLKELEKQIAKIRKAMKALSTENAKNAAIVKKNAAELKTLEVQQKAVAKEIVNTTKQTKQQSVTYDAQVGTLQRLEGEMEQLRAENIRLAKEEGKTSAQFQKNKVALRELGAQYRGASKEIKTNGLETNKLGTSYNSLTERNRVLSQRLRQIIDPLGKGAQEFKRLSTEINRNTADLSKMDQAMGRNQRNVGNYPGRLQSATGALGFFSGGATKAKLAVTSLTNALGLSLGAFAAIRVARGAVSTIIDFEQANAGLASVLGKTQSQISVLSDDALRLGAVTAKTAVEVVGLQEAYARLGFSQNDVLELTEPTIAGSIALRAELSATAELVGAVVKTFDSFDTIDAPDIIDQLTASTQQSALNFEKLNTALPIVGGAANAAGVPFNKLLALLGKLSDSGIDASSSATALRNIFIESAAQGLDYGQILDKIKNNQDKLTASNDEFGKRAAVSGTILAKNIELTDDLAVSIENSAGAAQKAADEQLNTLNGRLTILASAWDGLILSVNKGNGTFLDTAKNIVNVATELLSLVSGTAQAEEQLNSTELRLRNAALAFIDFGKIIVGLIKSFVIFKSLQTLINTGQAGWTLLVKASNVAIGFFKGGLQGATIQMKAFNAASRANLIGIIVTALYLAVDAFWAYSESADGATTSQSKFNDVVQSSAERLEKLRKNVITAQERTSIFRKALSQPIDALDDVELIKGLKILGDKLEDFEKKRAGIVASQGEEAAAKQEELLRSTLARIADEATARGLVTQSEEGEVIATNDLIKAKQDEIKARQAVEASTLKELATKNLEVAILQEQLKALQDLGVKRQDLDRADIISATKVTAAKVEQSDIVTEQSEANAIALNNALAILYQEDIDLHRLEQQEKLANINQGLQIAAAAVQGFADLNAARIDQELIDEQKKADETQAILEKQLQRGEITQQVFDARSLAIKERQAEEERKIRTKAAKQQKATAVTQALINGALGVTQALGASPPPASFALAAIVGALAAAEVATIALQPIPEFHKGGLLNGPKHAQGGIPGSVGGNAIELEGGESIINARSTALFGSQLSDINVAGGGVAFAKGGIPSFQSGGQVQRVIEKAQDIDLQGFARTIISGINDKRVSVVESDITGTQSRVSVNESLARF